MRIFTAAFLLAALLLLPGLLAGPSLDAAVFTQVASDIRHGETLYVTAWDHKPPGIYLLLALAQVVLPFLGVWALSWLVSVGATAGTAALVYGIASRNGRSSVAAAAGALLAAAAMAQYFLSLGGGLTEPLAALALAAAMFLSTRASPGRRLATGLALGALLAVSVLFSLQAIPGVAAIAALAVFRADRTVGVVRRVVTLALGAAVPAAAVATWLWLVGAWAGAYDALVAYPAAYRAVNVQTGGPLSTPVIAWTLLSLLFLIVPAALGVAAIAVKREGRPLAWASIAWVIMALAFFLAQGRFIAHYAIPLAVPLGVLASLGLERLKDRTARATATPQRLALAAPFVGALFISAIAAAAAGTMEFAPVADDHDRAKAVESAIGSIASPDASLLVWGNEPEVYLAGGRRVAGPYSYLYPLVTPGFSTPQMVASLVAALEADPPGVIVDAGSSSPGAPGFQPLLIDRPLASDGRNLDILDPLRKFVSDGYTQEAEVDGWVLYVRRQP